MTGFRADDSRAGGAGGFPRIPSAGRVFGLGIDVTEAARIRRLLERLPRAYERLFSEQERAYCDGFADPWPRYAARFAAKEAGMKAIGTGWRRGVTWQDFEVANLPSGRPTMKFSGKAAEIAQQLGVKNVALSLTHTAEQALAQVLIEN